MLAGSGSILNGDDRMQPPVKTVPGGPIRRSGSSGRRIRGWKTPVTYTVEGQEKMGNGNQGTTGPAAIVLYLVQAFSPAVWGRREQSM